MRRTILAALAILMAGTSASFAVEKLKVAIPQKGFWDSTWVEFGEAAGFFKDAGLEVVFARFGSWEAREYASHIPGRSHPARYPPPRWPDWEPTITAPGTGREFASDSGRLTAAVVSTRAKTNIFAAILAVVVIAVL